MLPTVRTTVYAPDAVGVTCTTPVKIEYMYTFCSFLTLRNPQHRFVLRVGVIWLQEGGGRGLRTLSSVVNQGDDVLDHDRVRRPSNRDCTDPFGDVVPLGFQGHFWCLQRHHIPGFLSLYSVLNDNCFGCSLALLIDSSVTFLIVS